MGRVSETDSAVARGPLRVVFFVGGWIFVGIGFIGVVVPGLLTTGFMVLAAWCFSRSSPRFEKWLLDLPAVGPLVRDYRAGLGMPWRAKVTAIAMIIVAVSISVFTIDALWLRATVGVLGVVGVWYVGWRVPTHPGRAGVAG